MAMTVAIRNLGIDVSQQWVDIAEGEEVWHVANTPAALRRFFKQLTGVVRIAVEPTHRYHLGVVEAAMAEGHTVYLVDAYRLSKYREAVGVRAKTDKADARLLARYLAAEAERLTPYQLPPKAVQQLRELLAAHGKLTQYKVALQQSLAAISTLARTRRALVRGVDQALALIDQKLRQCLKESDYAADAARCRSIPGIGPLNAAALVAVYHRGAFRCSDAFIAFMGLDVRVRESGRHRGQRKLTKRGDPEVRRLLFNAARAGARTKAWRAYYQQLRARGLSTTAAYVVVARKLARVAFALMKNQTEYRSAATCRA
jgi:transposase